MEGDGEQPAIAAAGRGRAAVCGSRTAPAECSRQWRVRRLHAVAHVVSSTRSIGRHAQRDGCSRIQTDPESQHEGRSTMRSDNTRAAAGTPRAHRPRRDRRSAAEPAAAQPQGQTREKDRTRRQGEERSGNNEEKTRPNAAPALPQPASPRDIPPPWPLDLAQYAYDGRFQQLKRFFWSN